MLVVSTRVKLELAEQIIGLEFYVTRTSLMKELRL